jgi:hypothetical protein
MVVALIALFVATSGVAYAANTIHSRDIVNDAVTTADIQGGGGRTGTIKNRDTNALLAIPKGYASIDAAASPRVLNYGGQQTSTTNGVSVARVQQGVYDVTFNANTGTGRFLKVDSIDDLSFAANGQKVGAAGGNDSSPGLEPIVSVVRNRSSANENQVKLRVVVEDDNGGKTDAADFSVFFYSRTVN